MLQRSHAPAQAESQQTPSEQKPEVHCSLPVQVAFCANRPTHCPAAQKLPEAHCASDVQLVWQALGPQVYGSHVVFVPGAQLPLPSQRPALVATPSVQDAAVQTVFSTGNVQVKAFPSHTPPHEEPSEPHAARPPTGAPFTGVQVPILPATLQLPH